MLPNIVHIIIIISIFQSLFILLTIFLKKERKELQNKLMLLVTFFFSLQIIMYNKSILPFIKYFKVYYLLYQTAFILPPLLYLLIRSMNNSYSFSKSHLLHFIPYALISVIVSILSFGLNIRLYFYYVRPILIIQGLTYILVSFNYLKNQNISLNPFKTLNSTEILGKFFLFFYILLWIVNVQQYFVVNIFKVPHRCFCEISIHAFFLFIIINALGFLAVTKPHIFSSKKKYRNTILDASEKHRISTMIEQFISNKNSYTKPELNIKDVGIELGISSRIISQIINDEYNTNFKDFLNSYRIRHAKNMLTDKKCVGLTIQEVLYSSGFNSKSNFNLVFKKHTDCTPVEYRKKHIS